MPTGYENVIQIVPSDTLSSFTSGLVLMPLIAGNGLKSTDLAP